ncbi:winged helix-turn-helix transcriptional regulator, partial [Amylibacter sp.]|nr:winged helix-turn-helix transcriptional regulator [Amylibacter sp.]
DKWSIIILRDISVLNRQTYSQLYNKSLEGISSATLAKRLKRLLDIGMLTVSNDKLHSQKKIYSLTEAAIEFVPIIFDLAHWSNTYHKPSPEYVKPIKDYMGGNKRLIKEFQDGLRKIHLRKIPIDKVDQIFQSLAKI